MCHKVSVLSKGLGMFSTHMCFGTASRKCIAIAVLYATGLNAYYNLFILYEIIYSL
jgi:hypothetical protein